MYFNSLLLVIFCSELVFWSVKSVGRLPMSALWSLLCMFFSPDVSKCREDIGPLMIDLLISVLRSEFFESESELNSMFLASIDLLTGMLPE